MAEEKDGHIEVKGLVAEPVISAEEMKTILKSAVTFNPQNYHHPATKDNIVIVVNL